MNEEIRLLKELIRLSEEENFALKAGLRAAGGGGGGGGTSIHNSLTGIQGGAANEYYHLTLAEFNKITALSGNLRTAVSTTTYTVLSSDFGKILGASNAGNRNFTLPLASSVPVGVPLTIKDESGTATTNPISITLSGSDKIDNSTSWANFININYESLAVYSDGTNYFRV